MFLILFLSLIQHKCLYWFLNHIWLFKRKTHPEMKLYYILLTLIPYFLQMHFLLKILVLFLHTTIKHQVSEASSLDILCTCIIGGKKKSLFLIVFFVICCLFCLFHFFCIVKIIQYDENLLSIGYFYFLNTI